LQPAAQHPKLPHRKTESFKMALPEAGTIAVLAEKPSVARDIARVVGAAKRGEDLSTATAT
jgi:hypothetical protein